MFQRIVVPLKHQDLLAQRHHIIGNTAVRTSNLTSVHICYWTPEHSKDESFLPVDVHWYLVANQHWKCIDLDKE